VPNSKLKGSANLKTAIEQIKNGENVVFLANHQSEADPQVVSILLSELGGFDSDTVASITYVAGHKVTTAPLAIPFSMGRNLLCIHSKKHIDAEPELKEGKQRENLQTMSAMGSMMKAGGLMLWVAPSGGRDRRDDSGAVPPAKFDSKTIDMFRLMARKSKIPTHFYPMSMLSYDLCPPPDGVVSGVGEERNIRFSPVGISVGEEVVNEGGLEARHAFTDRAEESMRNGYDSLLAEIARE